VISTRRPLRHVVVVGASAGIGGLVASELHSRGITLSTIGRRPSRIETARHWKHDLRDVPWAEIFAESEAIATIPIDGLVYVAGDAAFGRAAAVPTTRARQMLEANFWNPIAAAMAAERLWSSPRMGIFVYVSSISARRGVPFEAHYCAAKAAGSRFLEALQLEHPDDRIRFVSIYPGRLRTSFRSKADWYGLTPPPNPSDGSDPALVARSIVSLLEGHKISLVRGTRERAIDLADRISPALYDHLVLKRRVKRTLQRS
jgi:2-hydroxycyclohexanecarboxyl-CoA dehydrogenase